ncbi:potassium channel family protein [Shimia abyssi]|uniref:Ion channel n=1 Tax=Shimia abyssi TaxID=1662395 RepID=A0A2P8F9F5_9RHOB|nr:potassium channel family protein [Shimia abyssi]PSL18361.1 ion channel [Shimia abyssi]
MAETQKSNGLRSLIAHQRWTVLLCVVTFLILMDGFQRQVSGLDQITLIAMSILFLGVVGATERRTWLRAVMVVPVAIWFVLVLLNEMSPSPLLDICLFLDSGILLFGCMIIGFRQLFAPVESEYERLASGVFSYLLMAVIWGLIYWRIEAMHPGSFNLPDDVSESPRGAFMYFSMITMTTVGYGEITPAADLPRTLTGLQAVAGTMFVAIFIGRSVGRLK